jgi:small GTP-binding protein
VLQIWDTAGQAKYRAITNAYYKSTAGVLLVFDIANATSFADCAGWLEVREGGEGVGALHSDR